MSISQQSGHICHIYTQGHFAQNRRVRSGKYQATYPFLPPASQAGLLLSLAGIDYNSRDVEAIQYQTRWEHIPPFRFAVGYLQTPQIFSLLQKMHSYPQTRKSATMKASQYLKPLIQPCRVEFLQNLKFYIVLERNSSLTKMILSTIHGDEDRPLRTGIPSLGENNCLIDYLRDVPGEQLLPAHWMCHIPTGQAANFFCRANMPLAIDCLEPIKTTTVPCGLTKTQSIAVPHEAWFTFPPVVKTP